MESLDGRMRTAIGAVLGAAVALALMGAAAPQAQELQTIPTASYGLFPVDDSGVTGQLQVSSEDGGTRLVLTVVGLDTPELRRAAIYEGDCGPDRPLLLELEPLGTLPDDPFVSITLSELSFEQITEGEHFVYLFAGDGIDTPEVEGLDIPALACGEVGLGANVGE
jgi:hypothetical protein